MQKSDNKSLIKCNHFDYKLESNNYQLDILGGYSLTLFIS